MLSIVLHSDRFRRFLNVNVGVIPFVKSLVKMCEEIEKKNVPIKSKVINLESVMFEHINGDEVFDDLHSTVISCFTAIYGCLIKISWDGVPFEIPNENCKLMLVTNADIGEAPCQMFDGEFLHASTLKVTDPSKVSIKFRWSKEFQYQFKS